VNTKISTEIDLGGNREMILFADPRNLFDTRNVRWLDSNGRIGGELGDPSAYFEPRRIRLGISVVW